MEKWRAAGENPPPPAPVLFTIITIRFYSSGDSSLARCSLPPPLPKLPIYQSSSISTVRNVRCRRKQQNQFYM